MFLPLCRVVGNHLLVLLGREDLVFHHLCPSFELHLLGALTHGRTEAQKRPTKMDHRLELLKSTAIPAILQGEQWMSADSAHAQLEPCD